MLFQYLESWFFNLELTDVHFQMSGPVQLSRTFGSVARGVLESLEIQTVGRCLWLSLPLSGSLWRLNWAGPEIWKWTAVNSKLKYRVSLKGNDHFWVNRLGGYLESLEAQTFGRCLWLSLPLSRSLWRLSWAGPEIWKWAAVISLLKNQLSLNENEHFWPYQTLRFARKCMNMKMHDWI